MIEETAGLQHLADWLQSWEWPVTKAQLLESAETYGWKVTSDRPGKGARWDTGTGAPQASASVLDGVLARLTVPTSPYFDDDAAGRSERSDVFADQVSAVSEVLGPPDTQRPGRAPLATWELANGSALKVEASSGCYWVVTSPKFVEIQRDLGPNG